MDQGDPILSAVVVLRPFEEWTTSGPTAAQAQEQARGQLASLGIVADQGGADQGGAGHGGAGHGGTDQGRAEAHTPGGHPGGEVPNPTLAIERVKVFFTRNGFEVHAPMGMTFSIGGPRSQFGIFGDQITVDEDQFPWSVTVEGRGRDLSLDTLPEEIRGVIERISFPPPQELPG